jgi:hypothetical protein
MKNDNYQYEKYISELEQRFYPLVALISMIDNCLAIQEAKEKVNK